MLTHSCVVGVYGLCGSTMKRQIKVMTASYDQFVFVHVHQACVVSVYGQLIDLRLE